MARRGQYYMVRFFGGKITVGPIRTHIRCFAMLYNSYIIIYRSVGVQRDRVSGGGRRVKKKGTFYSYDVRVCVCACVCAPRLSSSGLCVHAFVYINVHADGPAAVSSSKRVCVLRPARSLRRLRRRLRRRCRRRHRPGHQVHATAALLGVLSVAAAVSDGPTGCCFQRSSSAAAADHAVNLTSVTYIIIYIYIYTYNKYGYTS